jgi:hypothetical protein
MAKCIVCSEKLSFFNGDAYGRCKSCMKKDVWPEGHPQNHENNPSSNTENSQGRQSTTSITHPASTTFASLAWVTVFISLIASIILGLLLLNDDQGLLAIIVFVSGCFGAVLLGLLAEISTNIARLVNNSR